jgi:hypothetical protein
MAVVAGHSVGRTRPAWASAVAAGMAALLLGTTACSGESAVQLSSAESATAFVEALNAGAVDRLIALVDTPFSFREQNWESAPDGAGFVLGAPSERRLVDTASLRTFMTELAARVRIEEPQPVASPPDEEALHADPLRGAPPAWRELDLIVFLRGMADVEHTAIVGVHPATGRVSAFYIN